MGSQEDNLQNAQWDVWLKDQRQEKGGTKLDWKGTSVGKKLDKRKIRAYPT